MLHLLFSMEVISLLQQSASSSSKFWHVLMLQLPLLSATKLQTERDYGDYF